jgi:hypothetical protein
MGVGNFFVPTARLSGADSPGSDLCAPGPSQRAGVDWSDVSNQREGPPTDRARGGNAGAPRAMPLESALDVIRQHFNCNRRPLQLSVAMRYGLGPLGFLLGSTEQTNQGENAGIYASPMRDFSLYFG